MIRKSGWRLSGQQGIRVIANEHKSCGASNFNRFLHFVPHQLRLGLRLNWCGTSVEMTEQIRATTRGCPYVEQRIGTGRMERRNIESECPMSKWRCGLE